MVYLQDYVDDICEKFEQSVIEIEKMAEDEKDDLYGDCYQHFQDNVKGIIKRLLDDVKRETTLVVNETEREGL